MEALLPAFIAVLLAECDGKVQRNTDALALHFKQARVILAALFTSTLANLVFAAIAGALVAPLITYQARTLLLGLALVITGVTMIGVSQSAKRPVGNNNYMSSLWRFARVQFGDNSQFLVFAIAARSDQPVLAGMGGLAATLAAALPPLLLPGAWRTALPMAIIRRFISGGFILFGLWVALGALRLI